MRNTKVLKIMTVITIAIITILAMSITTYAASNLQSNPTTGSKVEVRPAQSWIVPIRGMEQGYANSGDYEEINDDLTPTTSNNIDVHFMKTTEYGAMAILSASEYGKGNKVATTTQGDNTGSLTGNKTGVIIDTVVGEWTSAKAGNWYNERYFDKYTLQRSSHKVGDGIVECDNWHGASSTTWIQRDWAGVAFHRGQGGLFAYSSYYYANDGGYKYCGRGVAVCGEGF